MFKLVKILGTSIKRINNVLRYVCTALLFFMMLLGTVDVMGRYLFNKPVLGTFETFEILLPAIVLLGLGYTQESRAHVKVEILISRLSFRKQAFLNFITNGFALLISILILWRGWVLTVVYWRMGRRIPTIEVPMYLPQLLVPIGALLLSFVLLVQMLQYLAQAQKGD